LIVDGGIDSASDEDLDDDVDDNDDNDDDAEADAASTTTAEESPCILAKASAANLEDANDDDDEPLPALSGAEEMHVKQPHFLTTVISLT